MKKIDRGGSRSSPRRGELSIRILTAALLLISLLLWTVLKPPLQAPDEFAHYVKALSVSQYPWIPPLSAELSIEEGRFSVVAKSSVFHEIPFKPERSLQVSEIEAIAALGWRHEVGSKLVTVTSTAASYPPIAYALFYIPAEWLNQRLSPGAFGAFFTYRFVALFIGLVVWIPAFWLISRNGSFDGKETVAAGVLVGMPMMAFMATSINPDVLVVPLSTVLLLWGAGILSRRTKLAELGLFTAVLLILVLVKPTANALLAAIICGAVALSLFRLNSWRSTAPVILCCALALSLGWLLFYRSSPTAVIEVSSDITFWEYPGQFGKRLLRLGRQYLGVLGWLDTTLSGWWYAALAFAIFVAAAFAPWRTMIRERTVVFLFVTAAAFTAAHLILEWINIERYSTLLQGRYFLPVGVTLALVICRTARPARLMFLLVLALFNVAFMVRCLERYYDGSVERVLTMLT